LSRAIALDPGAARLPDGTDAVALLERQPLAVSAPVKRLARTASRRRTAATVAASTMYRVRRLAHSTDPRLALAWLWLLAGLLLGPVQAAAHAASMAGGFEICSAQATGTQAVDADGHPLAASAVHDCCQGGAVALPLAVLLDEATAPPASSPLAPAPLARPALRPGPACSRGPPAPGPIAALPAHVLRHRS
jgi:hypothetical protein